MPTIPLRRSERPTSAPQNPLPTLLHTPTGLALLELQGTINLPEHIEASSSTLVGKLMFPLYNPDLNHPSDTKWMKRVYFYVGENQRLSGEIKKLLKPFAVIKKVEKGARGEDSDDMHMEGMDEEESGGTEQEELEIVEIVRYKAVFSTRPEPVTIGAEDS